MAQDNSWTEWSQHVLKELERLNSSCEDMRDNVNKIKVDIGMLQVKSGVWGVLGGCIPVIVMIVIAYLGKH